MAESPRVTLESLMQFLSDKFTKQEARLETMILDGLKDVKDYMERHVRYWGNQLECDINVVKHKVESEMENLRRCLKDEVKEAKHEMTIGMLDLRDWITDDTGEAKEEVIDGVKEFGKEIKEDIEHATQDLKDFVKIEVEASKSEVKQEITKETKLLNKDVITEVKTVKDDIEIHMTNTKGELKAEMKTQNDDLKIEIANSTKLLKEDIQNETDSDSKMNTSESEIKTEISQQISALKKDIPVEIDRKLELSVNDIMHMIEKESQILREIVRNPLRKRKMSAGRNVYDFYFKIRDFPQRIKSGVPVYSPPWYVPQFDTCLQGSVGFLSNGKLEVRLEQGRYPKLMGLEPKPRKDFKYKVCCVTGDGGKEKVLKDVSNDYIDESVQKVQSYGWGYSIGDFDCDMAVKYGFIVDDFLLLKYTITVT